MFLAWILVIEYVYRAKEVLFGGGEFGVLVVQVYKFPVEPKTIPVRKKGTRDTCFSVMSNAVVQTIFFRFCGFLQQQILIGN